MTRVGTVKEIWRHPVKSMGGESLAEANFTAEGLDGDRRWGVVETETGKVLSAKRYGKLLEARAALPDGAAAPTVELPSGTALEAGDPRLDEALSDWLERPVALRAAPTGEQSQYDFKLSEFGVDLGVPDEETQVDTPAGTFYDLANAHVLTTASLAAGEAAHPDGVWDVRRFRPQVLVDTGDLEGFVENDWVGGRISAGEVEFSPFMPTVRCAMPTRTQPGLGRDKEITQVLQQVNGSNLGLYAAVATPGHVSVGEPVHVTTG